MTEEKKPQIGEKFLYLDDENDWCEDTIVSVGDLDEENGMYEVTNASGNSFYVYWDENDKEWTDAGE